MATGSTKRLRELLVETDMAAPLLMEFDAGSVVALCRRCPGKTEPNDDSAAVVQAEGGALVLAVADGVGA